MKYLSFIVVAFLFFSCSRNPLNVNVSGIQTSVKVIRFDKLLFETDTAKLENVINDFYKENKDFTDIYTGSIIKVGIFGEADMLPYLKSFVTDTVYKKVAASVLSVFSNMSNVEEQLSDGFKHLKYYYPQIDIPKVYTHFSGFNQAIFTSENVIGIGLDKYMGRECVYYPLLGIPQYKINNMYPEKIVPDLFYSYAFSKYDRLDSVDNLLSNMIYHGKLHYFTEAMCPELEDSINIGFTSQQLDWCTNNESKMWTFLIENRLIYSPERFDMQSFMGDGPFTKAFSAESPGRTGIWLGWQIVRSYMKNNKEITLPQLMEMNNAQQILAQSKYLPD